MTAFVVAMIIGGWSLGATFPTGPALYAASGAAFLSVVIGQAANAFACRSTRRPAWELGWFSNRFLLVAIAIGVGFALAMFVIPAAATLLDQQWPPAGAWIVVLASAPGVVFADALWKRVSRSRTRQSTTRIAVGAPTSSG